MCDRERKWLFISILQPKLGKAQYEFCSLVIVTFNIASLFLFIPPSHAVAMVTTFTDRPFVKVYKWHYRHLVADIGNPRIHKANSFPGCLNANC